LLLNIFLQPTLIERDILDIKKISYKVVKNCFRGFLNCV
jgi:hypothetical protein